VNSSPLAEGGISEKRAGSPLESDGFKEIEVIDPGPMAAGVVFSSSFFGWHDRIRIEERRRTARTISDEEVGQTGKALLVKMIEEFAWHLLTKSQTKR
jgi:hypothetical protein